LNERRRAEPCLEPQGAERLARVVNAEPWEPLPGMAKQRCSRCHYWFAELIAKAEATARCPDCDGRSAR
jgi:DNA-directed RNA polymerase subunit RPC12/RpoP